MNRTIKILAILGGGAALVFLINLLPTATNTSSSTIPSIEGGMPSGLSKETKNVIVQSEKSNIPKELLASADYLSYAAADEADSAKNVYMVSQSISIYRKVLSIDTGNLDAKANLGWLITRTGGPPMEGITLLRAVVAANPHHIKAQLYLGFLSMNSGQYEKAIQRFEAVKSMDSQNLNVYLYLAEAFQAAGKTDSAVWILKELKNTTPDAAMKKQAEDLLGRLQSN